MSARVERIAKIFDVSEKVYDFALSLPTVEFFSQIYLNDIKSNLKGWKALQSYPYPNLIATSQIAYHMLTIYKVSFADKL